MTSSVLDLLRLQGYSGGWGSVFSRSVLFWSAKLFLFFFFVCLFVCLFLFSKHSGNFCCPH